LQNSAALEKDKNGACIPAVPCRFERLVQEKKALVAEQLSMSFEQAAGFGS